MNTYNVSFNELGVYKYDTVKYAGFICIGNLIENSYGQVFKVVEITHTYSGNVNIVATDKY